MILEFIIVSGHEKVQRPMQFPKFLSENILFNTYRRCTATVENLMSQIYTAKLV